MFPESVKGKNVVITGASTGLGEQLAYQYARLGANIVITARRDSRLKEVNLIIVCIRCVNVFELSVE